MRRLTTYAMEGCAQIGLGMVAGPAAPRAWLQHVAASEVGADVEDGGNVARSTNYSRRRAWTVRNGKVFLYNIFSFFSRPPSHGRKLCQVEAFELLFWSRHRRPPRSRGRLGRLWLDGLLGHGQEARLDSQRAAANERKKENRGENKKKRSRLSAHKQFKQMLHSPCT